MAAAVRQYREAMPEGMHAALNELAQTLELAAKKVHDRHSERSYLANIMVAADYVAESMSPRTPRQKLFLLAEMEGQMAEAYEVLQHGDDPKDTPNLPTR